MASDIKSRVVTGVAWSAAEKTCSMLLQLGVSIVVARILSPDDFGIIAILTFFTAVSSTLADSGFSQALIRSRSDSPDQVRTVFTFNLTVSLVLYALCVSIGGAVAGFYSIPEIRRTMPVVMLVVPINAFGAVQSALLQRELRFATLSKIIVGSQLLAGVVAVTLALAGFGVWALVWQRVAQMAFRNAMQWVAGSWRGEGRFRLSCLREMAPFSLRVMSSDILSTVYSNISQLFIGKIYSPTELGFFNQAQKIREMPSTALMQSVQSVSYPALARIGDDGEKMAESYRQLMAVTAFVVVPLMAGLASVADDLVVVLIGQRWLPTASFLMPMAALGAVYPLSMIAVNIMKVRSDGRIVLRLEIVKKCVAFAALCFAIPCSTLAVAWTLGGIVVFEAMVNLLFSTRYTVLSPVRLAGAVAVPIAASAAMFLVVRGLHFCMTGFTPVARLVPEIVLGAAAYLAFTFRSLGAREFRSLVRTRLHC